MPRTDLDRLFDQLNTLSVGYGPVFRDFQLTTNNSFPPHNIIYISDNELMLEIAVAGFKKADITMEEHRGLLTIRGDKDKTSPKSTYQYRGIANRSFSKSFRMAEFFKITDATLEDGVLTVTFIKDVPEEEKPRSITIR